jgi:hypothetical protein
MRQDTESQRHGDGRLLVLLVLDVSLSLTLLAWPERYWAEARGRFLLDGRVTPTAQ